MAEKKEERVRIKEHLETDIDKLYELVRDRGIVKVGDAAKKLKIDDEQAEEWGRVLEEHNLVRLHYPPVGDPVLILKKFKTETKIGKVKKRKKLKPGKNVFFVNLAILAAFIVFIAAYLVKVPTIRISYTQAYLSLAIIIIIGVVLFVKFRDRFFSFMRQRRITWRRGRK